MDELEMISEWCRTMSRVLRERVPEAAALMQTWDGLVSDALARRNGRDLRSLRSDLEEMTSGLNPADRVAVDRELQARFGKGLASARASRASRADRILRRAKVRNLEECEVLSREAEEIWSDPTQADRLERVNALLLEFATRDN